MPDLIVIPEGKICDYVDGKFRNDTPEEYVRQNIEKRLVNEHKYPKDQIAVEFPVRVGSRLHRVDLAIFAPGSPKRSQEHVRVLIECKKESIEPTDRKDGIEQLKSYMSACPNCEWGMWTNSKKKEVFRKFTNDKNEIEFAEFNDIPSVDGRVEEIDRPKRRALKTAVEDNLLFAFKTCHNHIYVTDGLQKQPAFFELLKLIFCKIEDERNLGRPLEFYASSGERSTPDGQLTVKKRISAVFDRVKKKHRHIFEQGDEIKLKPRSLAYIVSEIQKYSLLSTNIDIKGKAYEELVGANLRGDRGEFFTPRNVMRMAVQMLSPGMEERVLDPACGTGGFLVVAMNKVISDLERSLEGEKRPKSQWDDNEKSIFHQRIAEIAQTNFFGFDINPDLVKATKMNMVMNNDGSGNILQTDSLLPPHTWEGDFRKELSRSMHLKESALRNAQCLGLFDVVVTNPPFGSKIPIRDQHILEQYDIGHIWRRDSSGRWNMSDRLRSSVPPEQLFIERCLQLLNPGGRMGIVLPDSILSSPGLEFIREWLIRKTRIVASIDLHVDTFQPKNGTQTSVLFLQKKTPEQIHEEERTGRMADYPIFLSMVDHIGHDKRGNPLFKRDEEGSEILVPVVEEIPPDEASGDALPVRIETKQKLHDDQTSDVAESFAQWREQEGLSW